MKLLKIQLTIKLTIVVFSVILLSACDNSNKNDHKQVWKTEQSNYKAIENTK